MPLGSGMMNKNHTAGAMDIKYLAIVAVIVMALSCAIVAMPDSDAAGEKFEITVPGTMYQDDVKTGTGTMEYVFSGTYEPSAEGTDKGYGTFSLSGFVNGSTYKIVENNPAVDGGTKTHYTAKNDDSYDFLIPNSTDSSKNKVTLTISTVENVATESTDETSASKETKIIEITIDFTEAYAGEVVDTISEFNSAVEKGLKGIIIDSKDPIKMDKNLTIPEGTYVSIVNGQLVISSGITLTVKGNLNSIVGDTAATCGLVNSGTLDCSDGVVLLTASIGGSGQGVSTMVGTYTIVKVGQWTRSYSNLEFNIENAVAGDYHKVGDNFYYKEKKVVFIYGDVVADGDLKIPEGTKVHIGGVYLQDGSLTIPSGKTITGDVCSLFFNQVGDDEAVLEFEKTTAGDSGFTISRINHVFYMKGSVDMKASSNYPLSINGNTVLKGSLTFTESGDGLTVTNGANLDLNGSGYSVTVSEGSSFTISSGGEFKVSAGQTFINNGTGTVNGTILVAVPTNTGATDSGTFTNNGILNINGTASGVFLNENGTINVGSNADIEDATFDGGKVNKPSSGGSNTLLYVGIVVVIVIVLVLLFVWPGFLKSMLPSGLKAPSLPGKGKKQSQAAQRPQAPQQSYETQQQVQVSTQQTQRTQRTQSAQDLEEMRRRMQEQSKRPKE